MRKIVTFILAGACIVWLFMFAGTFILSGCGPSIREIELEYHRATGNSPSTFKWMELTYDGCEYISTGNYNTFHKGNCKNHKK